MHFDRSFYILVKKVCCSLFITAIITFNAGAQSQQRMGSTAFPVNDNDQNSQQAAVNGGWEINGFGKVTTLLRVNAGTMFACTASGGIYKTNDDGVSWQSLSGSFLPGVQMGCLAVSATDTNVLYAGTGEATYAETYGWSGYGVFKSTDAGATWHLANTGMGNQVITDIIIDPNDSARLVACGQTGIYLSTNAGANWTIVTHGIWFHQLARRGLSDTIFAASDNRLFVSANRGSTWVARDLDPAVSATYINGRMVVAPSNDNVVYVSYIIDTAWGYESTSEVFQSTDGGVTFNKVYNQYDLPALSSYDGTTASGGYGFANYCLVVSPTDPNTLFTGAHLVFQSTDGGNSFNQVLFDWFCCLHTDIHYLAFDPSDANTIFAATDGGVFVSTDLGVDWQPSSNGLECSQYYSFGLSNLDSSFVIGGSQDNAIMYLNDDGAVHTYDGGDYYDFIVCDYTNASYSYTSANAGIVFDPYNRSNSAGLNLPDEIQSVTAPCMVFSPLHASTAFCFNYNVWISTNVNQFNMDANGGSSQVSWSQLTALNMQTVMALAISPNNDNLIYFITDENVFYTCTLSGGELQSLSQQQLPSFANVTASIAISTLNPNVIYVACNDKLYRSANAGVNWTDITGNLPPVNFQSVIIDPYSTIEAIYVISDLGVYYGGWTVPGWVNLNTGFPDSLQNANAVFENSAGGPYQLIAGAALYKGSNGAGSHIGMGTWGAGFQEVYLYSQKCNNLPGNWQLQQFGMAFNINAACYDATYMATGGSNAITVSTNAAGFGTGVNDQFSLVSGEFLNDGVITTSLFSVATGDSTNASETGLMIRGKTDSSNAPFVMIGVNGDGKAFMRSRAAAGADAITTWLPNATVPYPDSLRLVRRGDTVTVYSMFNNSGAWVNNGQVIVNLGDTVYAGVAAASVNTSSVNQSAFSLPAISGFAQVATTAADIENIAGSGPQLYPDPAPNYITIKFPAYNNLRYYIRDILGRTVLCGTWYSNNIGQNIDVSALSPGNYLVSLIDKQQQMIVGKARFIKE